MTQEESARARFEVGDGGSGCIVDFVAEPQLDQAGWMYGEGIVHHTAFQVADYDTQTNVKAHLEGLGFTDVSERKDRAGPKFSSKTLSLLAGVFNQFGTENPIRKSGKVFTTMVVKASCPPGS